MLRCSRHFLSTLVLASHWFTAHAAELGEARVSSHIGQPLVADIELAMIDDPAAPVSVRLASPEVYNGAGIAMPPVLASVNLSVMRRDGRQFLHVTSLRPVDGEHLHLYLELADKGQRTVRLATLWLTADPNPAPVLQLHMPAPARSKLRPAPKPRRRAGAFAGQKPAP
jgi:Tfp pilus assembly protein FimV